MKNYYTHKNTVAGGVIEVKLSEFCQCYGDKSLGRSMQLELMRKKQNTGELQRIPSSIQQNNYCAPVWKIYLRPEKEQEGTRLE